MDVRVDDVADRQVGPGTDRRQQRLHPPRGCHRCRSRRRCARRSRSRDWRCPPQLSGVKSSCRPGCTNTLGATSTTANGVAAAVAAHSSRTNAGAPAPAARLTARRSSGSPPAPASPARPCRSCRRSPAGARPAARSTWPSSPFIAVSRGSTVAASASSCSTLVGRIARFGLVLGQRLLALAQHLEPLR